MKVFNPIGSKERFLEMFQGVNKLQLNEVVANVVQTGTQLVEKAFDELKNKQANVKQTNTQTVGDENFVEIITNDNEGNEITFRFKIESAEADQDGVFNVSNAVLSEFKLKSGNLNVDMPENMKAIQVFNANHGDEIMNIVSEYASFETNTASIDDEIYEEAIKFIDKVPYKKGSEQMQTHKAYADQKPTNPDVRLKSDELDKFVSEIENPELEPEEDVFALPPDYSTADLPKTDDVDDNTKGIDPYDQVDVEYSSEEPSPEEQAIFNQAYDNLIAAGNQSPTKMEIEQEVNKLQGNTKPIEKTRAIPKGAEAFWENSSVDINPAKIATNTFNTLSPERKNEIILRAAESVDFQLGLKKFQIPKEQYIGMVREIANMIFQEEVTEMNETEEKKISKDYPDQLGKKFKPKNQFPKKKKKPQAVVKLTEESEIPKEYWGNPEDELVENSSGEGENLIRKNINGFMRRMDFNKLSDAYEELLKMRGDLRSTEEFQGVLSSLRDAITKYFNINNIPVNGEDVQNFFTAQNPQFNEGEKKPEIAVESEANDIEQLSRDKEETGDMLAGGLADDKIATEFDPEQIAMGMKVEMEHTDDPMVALEIAMDHLTEIPDYYTRLDKMEKDAGIGDEEKPESNDEETTDELLGFKPHNVGDYTSENVFDPNKHHDNEFDDDEAAEYDDYHKQDQEKEEIIDEEDGMDEYQGDIGDRYQDGEGNQFTVRNKVKGGVTLQGQGGEKEIATRDIGFLKKLDESKESDIKKTDPATWHQIQIAKKTLKMNDAMLGVMGGMSKEEAKKLLTKYGINVNESKKDKFIITEEQVKTARLVLKNRITEGMTKKEAVQILIKHNIK